MLRVSNIFRQSVIATVMQMNIATDEAVDGPNRSTRGPHPYRVHRLLVLLIGTMRIPVQPKRLTQYTVFPSCAFSGTISFVYRLCHILVGIPVYRVAVDLSPYVQQSRFWHMT